MFDVPLWFLSSWAWWGLLPLPGFGAISTDILVLIFHRSFLTSTSLHHLTSVVRVGRPYLDNSGMASGPRLKLHVKQPWSCHRFWTLWTGSISGESAGPKDSSVSTLSGFPKYINPVNHTVTYMHTILSWNRRPDSTTKNLLSTMQIVFAHQLNLWQNVRRAKAIKLSNYFYRFCVWFDRTITVTIWLKTLM